MHVKLEPPSEFVLPDLEFLEDMNFREEAFRDHILSDFPESSHSDDDMLRFNQLPNDVQFPDDLGYHHPVPSWRSNSISSRSSSSGSSFGEQNICDLEYKVGSISSTLEEDEMIDGVSPFEVMMSNDMKREPYSPESIPDQLISGDFSPQSLWDFINVETVPNCSSMTVPETPPITPPIKSPYREESPPTSPISISNVEESYSQIPNTAVITLTKIEPSQNDKKKNVSLAPKLPFKVVTTISANEVNNSKLTSNRAIKIQPRISSASVQKPIIRIIENPNKIHLSKKGSPNRVLPPKLPETPIIAKPIVITSNPQQSANFIHTTVPVSLQPQAPICTVVPERKISNLPAIAPALNPSHKQNNMAEFRAIKRQERMIKNRESASLSRKRKKEYLQGLEDEVRDLRAENTRLTMENEKLQRRLTSYENEREILKGSRFPMKRTSTTALLGVTFLLLFNISPIMNTLKSSNFKPFGHDARGQDTTGPLLNVGDVGSEVKFSQRSLLWIPSLEGAGTKKGSINPGNLSTICPLHINATESQRIENELRDWFESRLDSSKADWAPSNPFANLKGPQTPIKKNFHPKTTAGRENAVVTKRSREIQVKAEERALAAAAAIPKPVTLPPYQYLYPPVVGGVENKNSLPTAMRSDEDNASLGVTSLVGNIDSLLESIERRNDTYYVVSLSSDHLLLPASSHNGSARPKMSLLVPTPRSINDPAALHDQISLMQIDCEVTHTRLIRVSKSTAPLNSSSLNDEVSKESRPVSQAAHGSQPRGDKFTFKRRKKVAKNSSVFN